jgi:hypothetical protein
MSGKLKAAPRPVYGCIDPAGADAAQGGVTYSGILGYRALDVDYEQCSGRTKYEYDVLQHGPVSGLAIAF